MGRPLNFEAKRFRKRVSWHGDISWPLPTDGPPGRPATREQRRAAAIKRAADRVDAVKRAAAAGFDPPEIAMSLDMPLARVQRILGEPA